MGTLPREKEIIFNSFFDMEDPRLNRKTIDERVKMLVYVLQMISDLQTIFSCGGHKHKGNKLNPAPKGEFYVGFICFNFSSDTTIPLIQKALRPYYSKIIISRLLEDEGLKEKFGSGCDAWNLEGTEDPNIIAAAIHKEYKRTV